MAVMMAMGMVMMTIVMMVMVMMTIVMMMMITMIAMRMMRVVCERVMSPLIRSAKKIFRLTNLIFLSLYCKKTLTRLRILRLLTNLMFLLGLFCNRILLPQKKRPPNDKYQYQIKQQ